MSKYTLKSKIPNVWSQLKVNYLYGLETCMKNTHFSHWHINFNIEFKYNFHVEYFQRFREYVKCVLKVLKKKKLPVHSSQLNFIFGQYHIHIYNLKTNEFIVKITFKENKTIIIIIILFESAVINYYKRKNNKYIINYAEYGI